MWEIILAIVLLLGSFGGGVAVGQATAPKEITEVQNIEQHQVQYQMQGQVQVTVAGGRELQSVAVQVKGVTNITILTVTNGVTNK